MSKPKTQRIVKPRVKKHQDYTDYPEKFKWSYWGDFLKSPRQEIIDNRNKFVTEYDILKFARKHTPIRNSCRETLPMEFVDHMELYRCNNSKNFVCIVSPYGITDNVLEENRARLEENGWSLYNKLYSSSATTFVKVVYARIAKRTGRRKIIKCNHHCTDYPSLYASSKWGKLPCKSFDSCDQEIIQNRNDFVDEFSIGSATSPTVLICNRVNFLPNFLVSNVEHYFSGATNMNICLMTPECDIERVQDCEGDLLDYGWYQYKPMCSSDKMTFINVIHNKKSQDRVFIKSANKC